jgi:hypothetical protein
MSAWLIPLWRPGGSGPCPFCVQSYSLGWTGLYFLLLDVSGIAKALTGCRDRESTVGRCLALAWIFFRFLRFSWWKSVFDIEPGFESHAGSVIKPILPDLKPRFSLDFKKIQEVFFHCLIILNIIFYFWKDSSLFNSRDFSNLFV